MKKKLAVVKVQCKTHPSRPNDNNDLEEGPFGTPNTIRELVDKFALPEVVDQMADLNDAQLTWDSFGTFLQSDHQLLAYIKKMNHLKLESSRVQENLQAKVDRIQERTTEANHLLEEKTTEVGILQEALQKGELILAGS
ncbi:hypothetical protein COCNU_scaffold006756G000010 [Cocos nucifera]|nr:hypothetical protein [Cocos nucifera]